MNTEDYDDFIFMRYNTETNEHEPWHLIDIVISLTDGSFENFHINFPDYALSDKEYKKYGFLLHCIEIRKREIEKFKNYQEQDEWEDLIADLSKGW
jgi:hypothetical protein